ncbi:hypothetical protein [Nocardia sp. CC227C]|uniref:hypothetical protein n=1 Tax=Nocardia sp. CC227C TaxID=3044562 RepID=UPI00278BBF88|nr:hypothetical protein [Nocardia sp. CC227C]
MAARGNWDTGLLQAPGPTAKDVEFLTLIDADSPKWQGETGFELAYPARGSSGDTVCEWPVDQLVNEHFGVKQMVPDPDNRRVYFEAAKAVYCP